MTTVTCLSQSNSVCWPAGRKNDEQTHSHHGIERAVFLHRPGDRPDLSRQAVSALGAALAGDSLVLYLIRPYTAPPRPGGFLTSSARRRKW